MKKPISQREVRRCSICGWPLVENVKDGCTEMNCSMRPRPNPTWAERQAIGENERNRIAELKAELAEASEAVRKGIEAAERLAAIDHALRNGPTFYWPTIGYRVLDWRVPTIEEAADILIQLQGGAE